MVTAIDPSFPANQLERYFRRRIAALDESRPQPLARLAIRFCHVTTAGEQAPWVGFSEALHELLKTAAGGHPWPMLFFGLHAIGRVHASPRASVLKWPGAAYLRYDAGDAELIAAVRATIEGAAQAVPPDLLPSVAEIRPVLSGVRHWLENRSRNTEGALVDFTAAARGEQELHQSYLSPVAAISPQHQESLVRLRNLEPAIALLSLERVGLAAFHAALDEFVQCWEKLERARGGAREAGNGARAEYLCEARDQYGRAGVALLSAITRLDELDRALGEE